MNFFRTIKWIAVGLAGMAACAPAEPGPPPPIKMQHVDWDIPGIESPNATFLGKESHGLSLEKGDILLNGKKLDLPATSAERIAGAMYRKSGYLMTVQTDGSADLYKHAGESWKLHSRFAPDVESRNVAVRLTIVPGLVYLLNMDVKKEESLKGADGLPVKQDYADVYARVCLTERSAQFHAVPLMDPKETLLGAAYRQPGEGDTTVSLYTSVHDLIEIDLGATLAKPFRSGPGDDLAQSLFVFPYAGFVALTTDGWSVSDLAGKNKGVFPAQMRGWWSNPFEKNGEFHVYLHNGPGGTEYLIDRAAKKLVEVKAQ